MFSRRTEWSLNLNDFTAAVRKAQQSGREILDLTISNPTRAGIAYQQNEILAGLRDERALDYDPQPKGLLAAREAVAAYYRARTEKVNPENLVLTSSTSEGYSFVFRKRCARPSNPGGRFSI